LIFERLWKELKIDDAIKTFANKRQFGFSLERAVNKVFLPTRLIASPRLSTINRRSKLLRNCQFASIKNLLLDVPLLFYYREKQANLLPVLEKLWKRLLEK